MMTKIQSVGNKFTCFLKCLVHSMCDYNHSTVNVTMTRHIILNENTELYSFPEMKSGLSVQTFFRKSDYDHSPIRESMTKHTVCTVHNKT